jgi:LacI family transcriptional regulator
VGKNMSTIKDVAKKAGVSISTVSYALNDKDNVHPDTKAKILQVAKELNYTPNLIAKQLKTNVTKNIGIFVSHMSIFLVNQFVEKAKEILENEGYNVIMSFGQSANHLLLNRYVDAAIVLDPSIPNETIVQFAASDSPVYVIDRQIGGTNIFCNAYNEEDIAEKFMDQMIEKGYKDFAFLGGRKNSIHHQMRFNGFKQSLLKHDIDDYLYLDGKGTIQSGFQIAIDLVEMKRLPEFIFCANDYMAIGLIEGFTQRKINIPQDVAISGFDNYTFGNCVTPKLTTIGLDYAELGQEAANTIMNVIQNNEFNKPEKRNYKTYLKESC